MGKHGEPALRTAGSPPDDHDRAGGRGCHWGVVPNSEETEVMAKQTKAEADQLDEDRVFTVVCALLDEREGGVQERLLKRLHERYDLRSQAE